MHGPSGAALLGRRRLHRGALLRRGSRPLGPRGVLGGALQLSEMLPAGEGTEALGSELVQQVPWTWEDGRITRWEDGVLKDWDSPS